MGFLGMSSRFALLSLGLLALAGCQMADQKSPETADQNPTATLSDTLPRMPQQSIACIMRQKPARLP